MEKRIIPAELGHLEEATGFVEELLKKYGCPQKTQLQIRLAVEEIFVNIASYAYPSGKGEAEILCGFLPDPERIRICISDSGIVFDPLAKEDADTSEEALMAREGGLGILLVKSMMDSVRYVRRDGRNVLTVEKRL